jgi:LysM repeat protein
VAELEKAFLQVETGDKLPCLFNPNSIAVTRSNNWSANPMPGGDVSKLRFVGSNSGSLSLELTFDTTADGSAVTKYTGKLMKLMEVDYSLPGSDEASRNGRPPTVTFHWGDLHSFPAVVMNLSLNFTYFSSTGRPLRATASMSLQQYEKSDAFGPQNPTSGTPNPHRVHRVQPGETLDRISARYYGDSTQWRRLAAANAVEDPLALRPGTLLSIPRRTLR